MVVSCQLHVPGFFTFEETAPETQLDIKNNFFHHYFDSSKNTALIFTTFRADEFGAVSGLWSERSEIQFLVDKRFFSHPKG
jgi:hypothetical protein